MSAPCVELCDPWLTLEMTVALSYKGLSRVEEVVVVVVGGIQGLSE